MNVFSITRQGRISVAQPSDKRVTRVYIKIVDSIVYVAASRVWRSGAEEQVAVQAAIEWASSGMRKVTIALLTLEP